MRTPDLEDLVSEIEDQELQKVLTRRCVLENLYEHFSSKASQYSINANELYDYTKWVCSLKPKALAHTRYFTDICTIYYQLGYTADDIAASEGIAPRTEFCLRGILEAIEYLVLREEHGHV